MTRYTVRTRRETCSDPSLALVMATARAHVLNGHLVLVSDDRRTWWALTRTATGWQFCLGLAAFSLFDREPGPPTWTARALALLAELEPAAPNQQPNQPPPNQSTSTQQGATP